LSVNIDASLDRLATHYDKAYQTRQKVISAMSYPVVVSILAIGVVIFLLSTIVPMFVDMFQGFGGELPLVTQLVMGASEFTVQYWYLLVLFAVIFVGTIFLMKKSAQGRMILDTLVLKIPIFGKLLQKSALARLTRTLSSLFTSSVPILQAMTMTEKVVG